MAGIFINYRRDDAPGVAGRLFDYLALKFPRDSLFMDVDAMKPGVDFAKQLDTQVSQCKVLLAVIGPHWIDAKDKTGHLRLEADKDYVRIELASALKRDIPVIPILVDGAVMPTEDGLPDDLKSLAYRHALELRHTRFNSDADTIVHALEQVVPRKSLPWLPIGAAAVVALAVIIGGTVWWKKKHAVAPQPAVVAVNPPAAPPAVAPAAPKPAVPGPAPATAPANPSTMAASGAPLPTGQAVAAALGAATPAGLPAGANFGDVMNNIAFRGSVFLYQKINPDPAVCQAACRANAHCAVWTYTQPRDPDPQGGCSLKAILLPATPDPCCTSAIERPPPPELLQPPQIPAGVTGAIAGAELEGGTYRYFGGSDATPEACQSACRADAQCIAWDYARPGVFATDARCFLKNKASMQVSSTCCIAGFEQHAAASPSAGAPPAGAGAALGHGPFPNTNLMGDDYRRLPVTNVAECQGACKADKLCLAWTYVHPGVQGPEARCWLKNRIPQSSINTCCTSGIERSAAE